MSDDVQRSYDAVAPEYARRMINELAGKPLDRELLGRFAQRVSGQGPVCDLGCGPGQVGAYLADLGVPQVIGIDLSPEMVAQGRQMYPLVEFSQGNMLALDAPDHSWAGIAAFYSIIHIARPDIPRALDEMRRVLRPGGLLLLAFHVGSETLHLDEWWGQPVSVDFFFFSRAEMDGWLTAAGFVIEEVVERDPYPDIESQTRRAYFLARTPGAGHGKPRPIGVKVSI